MGQRISESKDNEQTNENSTIFEVFPEYLTAYILSFFSHKRQASIARISIDFHTAFTINKSQKNSISLIWNSMSDIPQKQMEPSTNSLICIRTEKGCVINVSKDGLLNASFDGGDNRIWINDRIYIKPSLIQAYKLNSNKNKELGIFIQTSIGAANVSPGSWNVGFGLGDHRFCFHPGYDGGAARLEGRGGWSNESMGFQPQCDILYRFEIFISVSDQMVYLRICDPNNVINAKSNRNMYNKQWKYDGAPLFCDDVSIDNEVAYCVFERQRFSLRSHCGYTKHGKVAMFGDVYMNVAERDRSRDDLGIKIINNNRNIGGIKLNAFNAQMECVNQVILNLEKQLKKLEQIEGLIVKDNSGGGYSDYQTEYVQSEMQKIQQKINTLLTQKKTHIMDDEQL